MNNNLVIMLKRLLNIAFFGVLISFPIEASADVNVAVVAPQSGSREMFGRELWEGAQIAVNELNENGGLEGEKVNLIMIDDRCDDRFAITMAQMMSLHTSRKDKISLIIGPYCSNSFNQVADIYAKADIFQIVPTPVSQAEAGKNHSGLIKMVGYQEDQGNEFYKYYQEKYPNQKVGLVYDSRLKSVNSMAEVVKEHFSKDNKTAYLSVFDIAAYDEDFERLAQDMNNNYVQIGYILGKAKSVSKVAKEWKDINPKAKIFIDRYQVENAYHEIMGEDVHVSISSEIGSMGMIERENATILNAALHEVAGRLTEGFALSLAKEGITNAEIYLSQNDGTLMTMEHARRYPILTIACGPTNSIRGASYLTGVKNAIVIDVGGTTTDLGNT